MIHFGHNFDESYWEITQAFIWDLLHWSMIILMSSTSKKQIKKEPRSHQNQSKITQNWSFLATYTPDMVTIWPHMACLLMFLSHTTYTSHILPHISSNGHQMAVNRGFLGENLPCSRLQKIIMTPFFVLEPCPIHQNDHIVHP